MTFILRVIFPLNIALGRMPKLEKDFNKYPDSVRFVRVASVYLEQGRHEEAIKLCQQGCRKYPNSSLGLFVLAKSYIAIGDYEKAFEVSSRSCLRIPDSSSGLRLHAEICIKLGNFRMALENLRLACKIDPYGKNEIEKIKFLESKINFKNADEQLDYEAFVDGQETYVADISSTILKDSTEAINPDYDVKVELRESCKIEKDKVDVQTKGQNRDKGELHIESGFQVEKDCDENKVITPEELVAQSFASASILDSKNSGSLEHLDSHSYMSSKSSQPILAPKIDDNGDLPTIRGFSDNSLLTEYDQDGNFDLGGAKEHDLSKLAQEIDAEEEGVVDVALLPEADEFESNVDGRNISTRTLAEIYNLQGLTEKAIEVYQELLSNDPENVELRKKLSALKAKI